MKRAREEREFKKRMTERGFGDAPQATNKQKPRRINKPTNYAPPVARRAERPSTQATDGSASQGNARLKSNNKKKEEVKTYTAAHKAKERRSPGDRNAAKATLSSQAKKRDTPSYAPVHQQAKKNKQVRAYEHNKYDNNEDPEELYRRIEQEEQEIRQHVRNNEELDELEDAPSDQYLEGQGMDRYEDQQESPDYADNQESPQQESPDQDDQQDDNQQLMEDDGDEELNPLLFVDVNLGPGRAERIVVYEGDTAEQLAEEFTAKHGLDDNLKEKLVKLLENQIATLLVKIDEEEHFSSSGTEN